ncbi:hypothetical protein ACFLYO_10635 [Chloroflexota bacterium]
MEEQSVPAPNQATHEILNWQYILLIVAIAVLMPLIASAPISLDRAERPAAPPPAAISADDLQVLNELAINAAYEDPSGVALNYPEGWIISPLQPGYFMLTNYPIPIQSDTLPQDFVGLQFDVRLLEELTILPDGSAPPVGTTAHELAEIIAGLILGSPEAAEITDITVNEFPAARFSASNPADPFGAGEIIIVTPDEATVAIIQTSTTPANEANTAEPIKNILDTLVLPVTDGS